MQSSDVEKSQLIAMIYDAAMNPSRWQPVLQAIQTLCGADQCTLFFYDAFCRSRNYASAARISADSINAYLNHFIDVQARDINNQLKDLPEGKVVSAQDLHALTKTTYEKLVGNEYMDKAWPNLSFQAGAVLLRSPHECAGLGLQSFKHSQPISGAQLKLLQELTEHFVLAIKIHQAISRGQQQQNAFANIIGNIHHGVLLLDDHLRLLSSNAEAIRIIEQANIFTINQHGQLCNHQDTENSTLAMLLKKLKSHALNPNKEVQRNTTFSIKSNNNPIPIKFQLFPSEEKVQNAALATDTSYLILLNDPNRSWQLPHQYLESTYSFTETECELLHFLVNGDTINDAAERCDISIETARWRLKKILKKSSTHSQAELSRLLLNLCDG